MNETFIFLMALFMIIFGIIAFICLVTTDVGTYGRYNFSQSNLVINAKLAWFLQELPSFAIPFLFLIKHHHEDCHPGKFCIALLLIHYCQRAFIYPFLIQGGKPTSLLIFILAFIFCLYNGFMQGYYIMEISSMKQWSFLQYNILIGGVIFFSGLLINIHSDHILRNLRKPGETGYKIPYGGLFNFVSSSNFFGEIIEWIGYAIVSWSLVGLAFAFFTMCNLIPRGLQHHRWYLSKFDDYPVQRKAVIPFIL